MSDLLPCPFCGGEASAVEDTSHSTAYAVGCFNGACALEPYVWDTSKAVAIAAWNRRALPATDARAEALKEAEKALRDWQDSLNVHRMPETAIAVGMAADVVAALINVPRE